VADVSSVYILLLSSYERRGRRFLRLSGATVLEWFRLHWDGTPQTTADGQALERAYGLGHLFATIADKGIGCPADDTALMALLRKHIHSEGDIEVEAHFVHVATNDDEVDIAYYFFDDEFAASEDALDRLPFFPADDTPLFDGPDDEDDDGDEDEDEEPLSYREFVTALTEG
jgi:hypothetical protein